MLTAVLISLAIPSLFGKPQVQTKIVRVQGWSIERRVDNFSGWVQCTAHSGRMRVADGELVFNFGPLVNTSEAIYRIDGGEAQQVQQLAFARAYWHRHEGEARLDNPSGGAIAFPARDIMKARTVAIRINIARSPQTFTVTPLQAVLDLEGGLGCQVPAVTTPERRNAAISGR